jgi:hypothetical protein
MVAAGRTPPIARAWGYRMNMPIDSFRSLFDKHTALRAIDPSVPPDEGAR